ISSSLVVEGVADPLSSLEEEKIAEHDDSEVEGYSESDEEEDEDEESSVCSENEARREQAKDENESQSHQSRSGTVSLYDPSVVSPVYFGATFQRRDPISKVGDQEGDTSDTRKNKIVKSALVRSVYPL